MTLKVILYTFKNIWDFENIKKVEELIFLARDLFYEESGIKIMHKLLFYLFSVNDIEPKKVEDTVSKIISYKKGDELMTTTAERWIKQGLEQGLEQGILNGKIDDAKKMLLDDMDLNLIHKYTDLSIEDIQKLKDEI